MAIARLLSGDEARAFLADRPPAPHRPAAVLVPIVDHATGPTVLLTRRAGHLAHHPGQVSFPGGRCEPEDAGPADTALREAREETGLTADRVDLIGRLDDYITVTGFRVTPFVGVVAPPLSLRPDPTEVEAIFEVPLAFLMDPVNHQHGVREKDGKHRAYFAIPYESHYIWGATAGILINLYTVLQDTAPTADPLSSSIRPRTRQGP